MLTSCLERRRSSYNLISFKTISLVEKDYIAKPNTVTMKYIDLFSHFTVQLPEKNTK